MSGSTSAAPPPFQPPLAPRSPALATTTTSTHTAPAPANTPATNGEASSSAAPAAATSSAESTAGAAAVRITKSSPASPAPLSSGTPALQGSLAPPPPAASAPASPHSTPQPSSPRPPALANRPGSVATPASTTAAASAAPAASPSQPAASTSSSMAASQVEAAPPPPLLNDALGAATIAHSPAAPSSTAPPASLPMAALGAMSATDAQRFGLGHLQGMGPGSSYSSPLQAFRPPTHVSQPLPPRTIAPQPPAQAAAASKPGAQGDVAQPSSVVPRSTPTVAPAATTAPSVPKQDAAAASARTNSSPASAGASSSNQSSAPSTSAYAASDAARAIPTNKNNPAFLNKLRSMVDDPNTDELIRWSPDGASFFVPNHVRFGDEVLPRFFKHNRFSSFVRQLNMYGFHKVPHLQQGALKHDSPTESELWEFSNPNFHRDHPEWLARVQRKKGVRDHHHDADKEKEPMSNELTHPASMLKGDFGLGAAANGEQGALQLTSVLNAINAIKTAQNSISTDLRHLQNSNQSLWQEAIESRQRAKRQQETINKILRFLAGVFGAQDGEDGASHAATVSAAKGRGGPGSSVRPLRPDRLMIEDGRGGGGGLNDFSSMELPLEDEEIEELPAAMRFSNEDSPKGNSPPQNADPAFSSSSRFTALGSPPRKPVSLPDFAPEAVSTPGGSRRLSSQTGNSILNALTSGEGSAWLANLFGAGAANQGGTNSAASTPGGGFKLDPQMVAALQQAIASGNSSGDQDYFAGSSTGGKTNGVDDSRFSFETTPPAKTAATSRASGKGRSKANGASKGKAQQQSKAQANGSLEHDALSKVAGLSQALVHSPSRTQPKLAGARSQSGSNLPLAHHAASLAPDSFLGAADAANNQQVGLPLARVTRDIQGTAADVDQVQNSINSLVESLKLDPSILQSFASSNTAAPAAPGGPSPASSMGQTPGFSSGTNNNNNNNNSGNSRNGADNKSWTHLTANAPAVDQAFQGLSLPDASQPPSAYAANAVDAGLAPAVGVDGGVPSSAVAPSLNGGGGLDADFDVDSFLNQFVDPSQAPGQSPAAFHAATSPSNGIGGDGAGGSDSSIFGTGLGLGGMLDDHDGIGTSPSFAFSPGTTAAFLQGGDAGNGLSDVFGTGAPSTAINGAGHGGEVTATANTATNSTASSAHSTPVVGSWGIAEPTSSTPLSGSVGSGAAGQATPMSISTPPPSNGAGTGVGGRAPSSLSLSNDRIKKRKSTTVENATSSDEVEFDSMSFGAAGAARSGKKTRKSLSPSSARSTAAP
ncbi:uncharacterized protein PFL1_06413 [Pseudozyma flocculosa PF-1]|uniref:HSF-type DNA-binding domain-containing protein n=2 Tax=Pseudozyma flocculosa TaxID=84751 RepID=A0A5C3ETR3_9BASI|nr:uncharacterized protein PFL1_06413 [Pseudozyma flocculosa PF-1]EPQ25957.1 hypothetical protein PFL1_06413 [Pseudozyma flocculosa PF-1]SPO35744.1 uncharacterized protein PSFLO_01215 [Pseudozyma flocculosa]